MDATPFFNTQRKVSLFQIRFLLYRINKWDTKTERNKNVFKVNSLMKKPRIAVVLCSSCFSFKYIYC